MQYKALFLLLFTLTHLYTLVLNIVHHRSASNPTPANVADVYDNATYQKWRAYHGEKSRLDILRTVVSWVLTMGLLQRSSLYALGAVLFVFSDFILAWNRFVEPVPYRDYLVLVTYYLAEWLLFVRSTNYRIKGAVRLMRF